MSPKQTVTKKYPEAISWHWANGWCIYTAPVGPNQIIGGDGWGSAARAWMAARRELLQIPDPGRSPPYGFARSGEVKS